MATKPRRCGYAGDSRRVCVCSELEITKYRGRLSGPLADRIDVHVALGAISHDELSRVSDGERSASIRARVERSRALQRRRYASVVSTTCNAHAPGRWLLSHGEIGADARTVLTDAIESLKLSARGFHRVLRVARTIADLCESSTV